MLSYHAWYTLKQSQDLLWIHIWCTIKHFLWICDNTVKQNQGLLWIHAWYTMGQSPGSPMKAWMISWETRPGSLRNSTRISYECMHSIHSNSQVLLPRERIPQWHRLRKVLCWLGVLSVVHGSVSSRWFHSSAKGSCSCTELEVYRELSRSVKMFGAHKTQWNTMHWSLFYSLKILFQNQNVSPMQTQPWLL